MVDQHILEGAGVIVALAISELWKSRQTTKRHKESDGSIARGFDGLSRKIDSRTGELEQAMNHRFAETNEAVAEVRAFCVGPDAKGGLRKDLERIGDSVEGLVERERKRLEDAALHGAPDRRRRA